MSDPIHKLRRGGIDVKLLGVVIPGKVMKLERRMAHLAGPTPMTFYHPNMQSFSYVYYVRVCIGQRIPLPLE